MFTREDLLGKTTVLVFYPFAFSPVCTTQLAIYNDLLEDFARQGRDALRRLVRRDVRRRRRSSEQLGVEIEQLSDFEPKGAACRAFGVYHPGGFPQRALVIVDPDGTVRWSLRGRASRRAARRQPDLRRALSSDLGSAPLPPVDASDHVRGDGPAGRRLRRLRVPVLRGARRALRAAGRARVLPALPGALLAPARLAGGVRGRGGRADRARSGRCTTRCSPTRAGSRTRTCGRARRRSGSTSRASTPTAARKRCSRA